MDKRRILSKKKDSGLGNEGIAGRYVKRDTPPVLRSKFYISAWKIGFKQRKSLCQDFGNL